MPSSLGYNFAVLSLVPFLLLLRTATAADPLFTFCSSSGNFTVDSPYEANLNKLMGDLYLKTPRDGFGMGSIGQYQSDTAYGLSLCRGGDLSSIDCITCVVDASIAIRKKCQNYKGATVWYDNCLLKYSDNDFFGKIDNQVKFYLWNFNNATDPVLFDLGVTKLLSDLSEKAYVAPKMFAKGEWELGEIQTKIYGMVQCTRDLSSVDCKKCLDDAVTDITNSAHGKQGGRVVTGSCNVRYEIYPFTN